MRDDFETEGDHRPPPMVEGGGASAGVETVSLITVSHM